MNDLKDRTKKFALRAIKLVEVLPRNRAADVLGKQLIRSSTSVGANYRAACRARSDAEFRAKLGIIEEESDESAFWLELITDSGLMKASLTTELLNEANELTAIMVSSIRTSRKAALIKKPTSTK